MRNILFMALSPQSCIVIALIGAVIQFFTNDPALARSGSIIVCIGIYRIFHDVKIGFSEIEDKYAENPFAGGLEDSEESLTPNVERAKQRFESNRVSIANPDAKKDMAILILGTLIWGFGDMWL